MLLKRYLSLALLICSFGVVGSCGILKSNKAEYQDSATDASLEVPEGLREPEGDAALIVPE